MTYLGRVIEVRRSLRMYKPLPTVDGSIFEDLLFGGNRLDIGA